jgi:uncharacterized short protein YbdD (DUF466 family)
MITADEGRGTTDEGRWTRAEPLISLRVRVARALNVVRRIVGVTDYDRYVAHMRAHHPNETPLTCEQFTRERMVDKYSRPGSRCC